MKKTLLSISFMFIFGVLLAQESISPIIAQNDEKSHTRSKSSKSTMLELPFFDDFSNSYFFLDNKKWKGNNVFVNYTYPVSPPSLGVATLDAIKNSGEFYSTAGYGNHFSADTMCSLPINLDFEGDKTIYLSFYYQAQGKGDNPEPKDSLMLEFYSPSKDKWQNVWSTKNRELPYFKQVIINIKKSEFLQKGFKFRFRNMVSLSGNNAPSKAVNVDHWHIDYVYLNKGRSASDTSHRDIAFIYPMHSFLKHYESMPWTHFLVNTSSQLSKTTHVEYKNNDNKTRHIDSIYYDFYDNEGNKERLNGGAYDIEANQTSVFNPPYTYGFLTNSKDSASFTITAKFITDNYDSLINNKLTYVQKFYDYYSYDDGTAEASYGLTGDGAQRARLAYKFNCSKKDTLRSVEMYFCRSLNNKSQKYFYLTIWDDDNGKPGKIIYKQKGLKPKYENKLNKFHTYEITEDTIVLKGVFYVGWIQTSANMLNIGMDFNRDSQKNIFYNIGGNWQNTKYKAALMIRPLFGKPIKMDKKTQTPTKSGKNTVKVFPNPATNLITVQNKNDTYEKVGTLLIFNTLGEVVHESYFQNKANIDVSHLKAGTYILKIIGSKQPNIYTQKIIKAGR